VIRQTSDFSGRKMAVCRAGTLPRKLLSSRDCAMIYEVQLRRWLVNFYDFKVLLEPDEESGGYVVSCPALAGCYSQGDTVDEALENITEAILLCLEDLQAENLPI
jgi:predicted RNase H-like HicB family nuclease